MDSAEYGDTFQSIAVSARSCAYLKSLKKRISTATINRAILGFDSWGVSGMNKRRRKRGKSAASAEAGRMGLESWRPKAVRLGLESRHFIFELREGYHRWHRG